MHACDPSWRKPHLRLRPSRSIGCESISRPIASARTINKNPGHFQVPGNFAATLRKSLPVSKRDLVQPGGKSSLLAVSVHLKRYIDFAHTVSAGRVSAVYVVRNAVVGE